MTLITDKGAAPPLERRRRINDYLFLMAKFLCGPPGFYALLAGMVICTALVPLGLTEIVTYVLSVLAIVITGVVLIQGYRDTAALHAKLDELIVALKEPRNEVVGLEHEDPAKIREALAKLEDEAKNGRCESAPREPQNAIAAG